MIEAGRINYGLGRDNGGLSWIVVRSIDTLSLSDAIEDDLEKKVETDKLAVRKELFKICFDGDAVINIRDLSKLE